MNIDKYFGWLRARSKEERQIFWVHFIILFALIAFRAHFLYIGWNTNGGFPEVSIWVLNPVYWLPYAIAGYPIVGIDYINCNPCIPFLPPPQQHMFLYVITVMYWLLISFIIIKSVTWWIYRSKATINENIPKLIKGTVG